MDSSQYLRERQWSIAELYVDHQLLAEDYWDEGRGARWVIGRPNTSNMRTEIIAGICGSLIVHGDCDTSRFAHYGDRQDAFSRLCWMGLCDDVGYYVAQKAAIGMGRPRCDSEQYDEDVAKHDIKALIKEYEHNLERVLVLKEALEEGYTESEEALTHFFYSKPGELWDHRLGEVVAQHVVVGHLAVQRCCYLLFDKYGDEGPPACRGDRRKR